MIVASRVLNTLNTHDNVLLDLVTMLLICLDHLRPSLRLRDPLHVQRDRECPPLTPCREGFLRRKVTHLSDFYGCGDGLIAQTFAHGVSCYCGEPIQ